MIWFTTLESGYQLLSYMVSRVVSIVGICDYWVLGKIDQTDSCIASQHVLSNRKVNIVVLLFQYPPWPLEPPKQPLPITKTSFIIEKSKKISLPRKIGSLTISLTIVFIISKIVILFLPLWCILHRAHDKICTRISWIKNLSVQVPCVKRRDSISWTPYGWIEQFSDTIKASYSKGKPSEAASMWSYN